MRLKYGGFDIGYKVGSNPRPGRTYRSDASSRPRKVVQVDDDGTVWFTRQGIPGENHCDKQGWRIWLRKGDAS